MNGEDDDLNGAAGLSYDQLIAAEDEHLHREPGEDPDAGDAEIPPGIRKYLKDDETRVIVIRRHWIRILVPIIVLNGGLITAGAITAWAYAAGQVSSSLIHTVWIAWVAGALWALWKHAEWRLTFFAVTGHRVLLVEARHLLGVRVSQLPIARVRDLALHQSAFGRVLGYGTLDFASIGTENALDCVDHLSEPEWLYQQINELIMPESDRKAVRKGQRLSP